MIYSNEHDISEISDNSLPMRFVRVLEAGKREKERKRTEIERKRERETEKNEREKEKGRKRNP